MVEDFLTIAQNKVIDALKSASGSAVFFDIFDKIIATQPELPIKKVLISKKYFKFIVFTILWFIGKSNIFQYPKKNFTCGAIL